MTPVNGPSLVELRGVAKRFGGVVAVEPLDLAIGHGDFLAILGPSGCGKTTLLNMIAGFLVPDAGVIHIGGQDVTRLGPERRPTNMVFQGYGLFPHMTVWQNISYGLRIQKVPRPELEARAREVIALVHLEGFEERSVTQLSGGQQQRVALARALVMRPKVLLLDEPLAALDLKLRRAMQAELRRIHHSIGGTFVFVTHDQEEAMGLANRIAVMERGRLVQEGSAEEIYRAPKTHFVSTFIGEANVFRGERRAGELALAAGPRLRDPGPDGTVVVIVRPETITLRCARSAPLHPNAIELRGRIEDVVFLGAYVKYVVAVGGQPVIVHSADESLRGAVRIGAEASVAWRPCDHRVLDGRR